MLSVTADGRTTLFYLDLLLLFFFLSFKLADHQQNGQTISFCFRLTPLIARNNNINNEISWCYYVRCSYLPLSSYFNTGIHPVQEPTPPALIIRQGGGVMGPDPTKNERSMQSFLMCFLLCAF